MNADQIALIPDHLLRDPRTSRLCHWLEERGWQLSLLELDSERRHRGLRNQTTTTNEGDNA